MSYADDLNTTASDPEIKKCEDALQPYLNQIYDWTVQNDLQLNRLKSTATLFTTDQSELKHEINLTINNEQIPTISHLKILGVTFDQTLKFNEHAKVVKDTASKSVNILKSLTSTKWGKQKETIVTSFKAITRPILEYAGTV